MQLNSESVIAALQSGARLFSEHLCVTLVLPNDSRVKVVRNSVFKALLRKRRIVRNRFNVEHAFEYVLAEEFEREFFAHRKEISDRMSHFYKADGKLEFPNSAEGDLLKLCAKILWIK